LEYRRTGRRIFANFGIVPRVFRNPEKVRPCGCKSGGIKERGQAGRKMLMVAKDIMTRDVITVSPTMTVKKLAMTLVSNQISGAPVIAKNGKIIGIVSEADIVAKKGKEVKSIMSKKVRTINEETSVDDIARLMTTHKVSRLPVVRGEKLVGIVSRADIVNAIAMGKHIPPHTPVYDL
jgi:CBS domain-containing protein